MKIVKKTKLFTLRVYPELGIVSHQMNGFVEGADFQDMMLTGVAAYEEHGCTKYLSDDSMNPMMNQEDLKWGREVWEPKILKAGWKFWALVVPEKIFAKMAMRGVMQRYEDMGVSVKVFKEYDEALDWLEKQ
ncbi:MAG: STAS/SEC14 domain-containing protein [Deltaproteobacteria bacterium]|nr:STAS/SEC14 domain-containing protein [Deltaproteobacteria bacterium]